MFAEQELKQGDIMNSSLLYDDIISSYLFIISWEHLKKSIFQGH